MIGVRKEPEVWRSMCGFGRRLCLLNQIAELRGGRTSRKPVNTLIATGHFFSGIMFVYAQDWP